MSTICQGFSHFRVFFASLCIGKLATSSIRVNRASVKEVCVLGHTTLDLSA